MASHVLPPLTSVVVVCRSQPQIEAIHPLVDKIDSYVGIGSQWTLPRVCGDAPGALRLLPRIVAQESKDIDPLFKRKLFADAMVNAAHRGDLEIVRWLVEQYLPAGRIRQAVETAAAHRRLEILQWLRKNHNEQVVWGHKELFRAAKANHFDVVQWLYKLEARVSADDKYALLYYAMENGNVEMVEWLSELDLPRMEPRMWSAAWNGHLAVIKWVSYNLGSPCPQSCMDAAVSCGHLNLAMWLRIYASLHSTDASAIAEAARSGHLKTLMWALETLKVDGAGKLGSAMDYSAGEGHLEVVKYLFEQHHAHCSIDALNLAAGAGHFEIVKYLHECCHAPCSTDAMDDAASAGHFEIVKWLHANRQEGCTQRAMDAAARLGNLEMVKWFHETRREGCTSDAMDAAAASNHLPIIEYLHQNRREGCTIAAMDRAAASGHLEVVQWLHFNRTEGCSTEAIDRAAAHGHLEVVQWLHSHRNEGCTVRAMNGAAKYGHLKVLQWLHANRQEGCTGDAICYAANFGRLEVVKWLLVHRPAAIRLGAMNYAILGGHFDVVQALHRDGRSECTMESFRVALRGQQFEIFQFLVREYGNQFPNLFELLGQRISVYARDCIDEMSTPGVFVS